MHRVRFILIASILLGSLCLAAPARAQRTATTPVPSPCSQSDTFPAPDGAKWLFCVPTSGWNGDLVVWGHGYTAFDEPLDVQGLQSWNIDLPTLVQQLGYAFATTSYPKNGLAILEGVDDITQLVTAFHQQYPSPPGAHTYMVGASEGGIITTLLIERNPELFSGGLAACGAIGDFPKQIDYWGDYRVLFNYFFPRVIPTDTINPAYILPEVIENWYSLYEPAVTDAITSHPDLAVQLIHTSNAPVGPLTATTTALSTTLDLQWYNVFATDDSIQELGGNPYDNTHRRYQGSSNDQRLNLLVQRLKASPTAVKNMQDYQTSGNLTLPLVTLHTTGDDHTPFWQEILYRLKAHPTGAGRLTQIPVNAYGHCNFTTDEVLGSFALLVSQVTGQAPAGIPATDLAAIRRAAYMGTRLSRSQDRRRNGVRGAGFR